MIQYKGYTGVFEYDPESEEFHGHIVDTRDYVEFVGSSVDELREEMKNSLEFYFEACKKVGKEPEKPYSGHFRLRLTPALHRKVAVVASSTGVSMNDFAAAALERATDEYLPED